ncbi:sulfur carrier protein ThiS [Neobacillus sp. PS3-40]|uniref:sulfur carrier protein ThiS n=1 Tax=Neobacillus sp. PS3-40 TaxID=3070679 RepID=UPI0027E1CED8|nr:sulfur carrier protein ThiS [Neobacillus sp. PS3-40]WML44829.1 sulfur carrier protein ThiS [Neobacillus sp. PS3-40]
MKVNGTSFVLEKEQSLFDFLIMKEFNLKTIAVERNGEIIPKAAYKEVLLENEDSLEIVQFVGGG